MLPVVWRKQAREDWRGIITFVEPESPKGARTLQNLLRHTVERLPQFPYLHREGREGDTREAVFHPNYFIVYRVTADQIQILRVLHARRQYP